MVFGLLLILGAIVGFSESKEVQEKHDTSCGGGMEVVLDRCEESSSRINAVEIAPTILSISGMFFLYTGRSEVKISKKEGYN